MCRMEFPGKIFPSRHEKDCKGKVGRRWYSMGGEKPGTYLPNSYFHGIKFFFQFTQWAICFGKVTKNDVWSKTLLSACTYSKLKFAESLLRDVICIVIIIHNYVEVDFNICRIGGNLENHCEYILQNILLHWQNIWNWKFNYLREKVMRHQKSGLLKSRKNFAQMLNEEKHNAMIIIIIGRKN